MFLILGFSVLLCLPISSGQNNLQPQPSQCTTTTLEQSLVPYDSCLNSILDQLFHRRDQQTQLQPFLQRICNSEAPTRLRTCHTALDQSLSHCLSFNQRELLGTLKASSWSGLNFICQNAAISLTEFREQGRGYECLERADRQQNECLRRNPILSMYIERYEGPICEVTQPTSIACLTQAFQMAGCSDIASLFLTGYYNALIQATPCGAIGIKSNVMFILSAVMFVSLFSRKT